MQPHPPPQPYQQPYPFQQYSQQSFQPPKKKRTGLIVTAIIGVLVLVGGGVTAAVLVMKDEEKPAAKQEEAGAPDDGILEQKTVEPVKYGDMTVVDACTLMPVTLLEETGFGDVAHGGHTQTSVEKSAPAAEATVKDAQDGISSCRYDVHEPERIDFLALTVHQAPFNDPLPPKVIGGDDTALTVGGLRAFAAQGKKPGDFFTRIYSADGRTAAYLVASRLSDDKELDYEAAHAKLLERIALNLTKATGEQTRYAHTGRYQDVPPACAVLTGELFEQLAQAKNSGVVETEVGEGEVRQASKTKNPIEYHYFTKQTCQRSAPEWHMGFRGPSLKMELKVHRDARSAKNYEPDCDPNSPSRQLLGAAKNAAEKVGDGDTCAFPIGNSLVYSFIVGRTQVRLTPYGKWAPKDVDQFIAKFTPVAQKVADEVRKAIG